MNQPTWKLLGNLGDENYVDHGGFFVYEDTTGVYGYEADLLISENEHEVNAKRWTSYRFPIDKCMRCTNGIADNPHHPDFETWFSKDLAKIASFGGMSENMLKDWFCDAEPVRRAQAYRLVGEYEGYENLDPYPLHFTNRADVEKRYPERRGS
jgi:hypothetical protein